MKTYAFILGRKYLLSVAELIQVLGSEARIIDIVPDALIATLSEDVKDPQTQLNRLGGTIKIVEIFDEESSRNESLAPTISEYLSQAFADRSTKLNYAVSLYSFAERSKNLLKKTLLEVKKNLKKAEIKSRFINKDFKNPESAAIHHEKLVSEGAEIVVIQGHHKVFMGRTVALQDFESYSRRDYDRPERDARLGMLPPKLAQMLINLAGLTQINQPADARKIIYDPFCGAGTILTEALLMGFSVLGSDKNADVLEKSRKNIDFTLAHRNAYGQKHRLFVQDAEVVSAKEVPEKIEALVTESYLGPALSKFPPPELLKKNHQFLLEMHRRFFLHLQQFIKSGTPIIITFPIYRQNHRMVFLEVLDEIQNAGFKAVPLIPREISAEFNLPGQERKSLMYDRPDQIVGREVWKFVKV